MVPSTRSFDWLGRLHCILVSLLYCYVIFACVFKNVFLLINWYNSDQLESATKEVSAVFLVGGFSENRYVQSRIKETYSKPGRTIAVPVNPMSAIVRGAAMYGM